MKPKSFLLAAAVVCILSGCNDKVDTSRIERIEMAGTLTLEQNETSVLTARVVPEDAINKELRWFNTDSLVARYTPATGEVTALKIGTTIITARAATDNVYAQCLVTVVPVGSRESVLDMIPDTAFRNYCNSQMRYWDGNKDGLLSRNEAAGVTQMDMKNMSVLSLEGLEHFTGLNTLNVSKTLLTKLDVSKNTNLAHLDCAGSKITSLNASGLSALIYLNIADTPLTSLDISDCVSLERLPYITEHPLTSLNASGCTGLTGVLQTPEALTSLDVSGTRITELYCGGAEALTSLRAVNCSDLTILSCSGQPLTLFDVSGCSVLTDLSCGSNNLTSLDVSTCTALTNLSCVWSNLTSLDISNCTKLVYLSLYNNPGDGEKFVVKAWFDNDNIPEFFPHNWVLEDGRTITVDYQKVD